MLEERHLKLEVNRPSNLVYNADGDKLARAFGNLLKNAINYSYEFLNISLREYLTNSIEPMNQDKLIMEVQD